MTTASRRAENTELTDVVGRVAVTGETDAAIASQTKNTRAAASQIVAKVRKVCSRALHVRNIRQLVVSEMVRRDNVSRIEPLKQGDDVATRILFPIEDRSSWWLPYLPALTRKRRQESVPRPQAQGSATAAWELDADNRIIGVEQEG